MKHVQIILSIAILLVTLIGCENSKIQNNAGQTDNNTTITEPTTDDRDNTTNTNCNNAKINNTDTKLKDTTPKSHVVKKDAKNQNENNNKESKDIVETKDTIKSSTDISKQKNSPSDGSLKEKVKNYIINGQGNKCEAEKMKWSEAFLNKVDIDALYKQYISNGGTTNNLEKFSKYMTLNAPIPSDWKKLFEKDLYNTYGEKVVRLEHLEGDLYQAYINHDGKEIPYVVVSSRTGYFHG